MLCSWGCPVALDLIFLLSFCKYWDYRHHMLLLLAFGDYTLCSGSFYNFSLLLSSLMTLNWAAVLLTMLFWLTIALSNKTKWALHPSEGWKLWKGIRMPLYPFQFISQVFCHSNMKMTNAVFGRGRGRDWDQYITELEQALLRLHYTGWWKREQIL